MPRNRSGGLAALSSSVRRTPPRPTPHASHLRVRRRIVVAVLALVSLALITGYFRESEGGPLHEVQSVSASAMHPFEVGAERVARPFRDAYGWLSDLFNAREENERLKEQVERLTSQAIQNATAASQVERLEALLEYRRSDTFPGDYDAVGATVIADPPNRFEQFIVVSVGSARRRGEGCARRERRGPGRARDQGDARPVAGGAADRQGERGLGVRRPTEAYGVIRHGAGSGDSLILDRVDKADRVQQDDVVVTSGRRFGLLPSIYPRNIPIGMVTSVGQTDIDVHQQIQVDPFVDFSSLDSVLVLVRKTPEPTAP